MKTCSKCSAEKPLVDYYTSGGGRPIAACKSCVRGRSARWYVAHTAQALAQCRAWAARNIEKVRRASREYARRQCARQRAARPTLPTGLKHCNKCGEDKAEDLFYGSRRTGRPVSPCKECCLRYYAVAPDPAKLRAWREVNRDRTRANGRRYAKSPKGRAARRRYYSTNRAHVITLAAARPVDREKRRAQGRRRYAKNPTKYIAKTLRRQHALVGGDLTEAQWQEILVEHGHSCAYCRRSDVKLTRDHVIPVSRGGPHTKANIVPACKPCNTRKNDRTPDEVARGAKPMWAQRRYGASA